VDRKGRPTLPPVPGLVVIFANRRATQRLIHLEKRVIELGRVELSDEASLDTGISRKHVHLSFHGTDWEVADLESRNGTFANGERVTEPRRVPSGSVLRLGGTVLLLSADIRPFKRYGLDIRDGKVGGPALHSALEAIKITRGVGGMASSLLITGESGTGKELAAHAFHACGPRPNAPFTAVNCATIPKELAERLLFGSRRGAFSGATDAPGYVHAAHGGTLFLDEIAELSPDVQSKLLRMLETHEVLRLGATAYEKVEVSVCAATWRDLREEVRAGRFREDLYFRIGQPEVRLPPLRERIEEIPWHVQQILSECGTGRAVDATSAFVEACALRAWPGNVRELRAEVRRAAAAAMALESPVLTADDLGKMAGKPIAQTQELPSSSRVPRDEYAAALAAEGGNIVGAARRLGVHRNRVRRWLERHHLDPARFKSSKGPTGSNSQ
jgi:transcriptional regulator with AAA-type ATPase domain